MVHGCMLLTFVCVNRYDAGVQSVTIGGEGRNLLLVTGVGIDSNRITEKLRRKVGPAEVVELRTVDDGSTHPGDRHRYRYQPSPSPYKHAAARDLHHYTGSYLYQNDAVGAYGQDYYGYGGGGGGGYQNQGQYNQHDYFVYPPQPQGNTHTVVHNGHGYSDDPNCAIM